MHATRAHLQWKTTPENVSCFEKEDREKYLDGRIHLDMAGRNGGFASTNDIREYKKSNRKERGGARLRNNETKWQCVLVAMERTVDNEGGEK